MSNRVVIIYDCPLKSCDKLWLKEELESKGYCIRTINSFFRISNVEQRGKFGKAAARMITFWQSIKGLIKSGKGDTVICWSQWSGLFFNLLPGARKRYIISCNWLTPVQNEKTRKLYAKALQNRNLAAVINSPETKERILRTYRVEDYGNIIYIPDVFDDREPFRNPVYREEQRFCFSGGRANRDWELLMEIAAVCPEIDFRFIAVKSDWNDKIAVPKNVQIFFDLEPAKYYQLLKDSYMAIFPLKEDRVSGLINLLKSVQMGKPVLTTGISFTGIYFPEENKNCLLPFGDSASWKKMLEQIWNYDEEQYKTHVKSMQEYIRQTFSPEMAGKKIDEIIRQFRCSME